VGYFKEDRTNAKIGETNDNRSTSVSGGVRALMSDGSSLDLRAFFDRQRFHSAFLAVTNATSTRTLVRLSLDQRAPSDSTGGMVQWAKPLGRSHTFSVGADWRWVEGDSNEDAYSAAAGNPVVTNPDPWGGLQPVTIRSVLALQRVSGGTQRHTGAFVQDIFTPTPKLNVTFSGRVDHWRNYNGHNLETAVIPGTTVNNLPSLAERSDLVVSPRVGALYHFSDRLTGWAAISSGFRAPTLNELYRQFRVGTTLVLAPLTTIPPLNRDLEPERLVGGEAGINISPVANVTWRTTWFDNRVTNPVLNVTICAGNLSGTTCVPSAVNVTQQRQNVGETRIWGVHTDAEYRAGDRWRLSGGYLYTEAKVTDGGAVPALVGTFLQQVPKHRGTLQVAYADPKYVNVTFGMQYVGLQYDDDLNVRGVPVATLTAAGYEASTASGMPGYAVASLAVSRAIGRNLEAFFGVQNLADKEYFVGTLPTTIGSPRLVNGGLRVRFSAR
jgi:outer membrane receptor protein involved in Fe transport